MMVSPLIFHLFWFEIIENDFLCICWVLFGVFVRVFLVLLLWLTSDFLLRLITSLGFIPLLSGDVGSLKEAAWMSRLGSLCWNCMRGVALNGSLEARNYSFPSIRTIWPPSWSYYWLSACLCCWIMLRATLFSKMLNDWGEEGNLSLILDEATPPVAGGCCFWEGWSPPIWFIWRRALYIWSFLPSSSS